ncbi:putative histone deacetylase [Rosa chinensis]|uniref:Putative histone deacetylase n=1 Tax=Rosa chinensis TaxID=74649 RepID=A0A2P6PZM2_ROSCH|nr:putative histone deacetylase [Rosa chinensis]
MGNTCYLNSVLQCLTYTGPLAAYLQSGRHRNYVYKCSKDKHMQLLRHSRRLIAARAGIALIDSVVEESKNSRDPPTGFALIRPPRHHAISKGLMGFCVFGNIAIAAHYAQCAHGLKGVFIIDFDVHHGNGTNDAFYEDLDIFFLSTHQKVVQRWPCLWNGTQ